MGLPYSEESMMTHSAVLIKYCNVTHRQTDRIAIIINIARVTRDKYVKHRILYRQYCMTYFNAKQT